MPKSEKPRRLGKGDIKVYSRGGAKEGGKLDKAGVSLNVPKKKPATKFEKPMAKGSMKNPLNPVTQRDKFIDEEVSPKYKKKK